MRLSPLVFSLSLGLAATLPGQEEEALSSTDKLRDSVREWIETMREIQKEETSWERDKEVLEDQRTALQSEIDTLQSQIDKARTEKEGADKEALEDVARRDELIEAKSLLAAEVRKLEEGLLARMPAFPKPLMEEPRVKQLAEEVKQDAKLSGKEAESGLSKRLNNVLNLITEAEKWQQTTHLRDELHRADDGREFNMKVVYFGLGAAYAVNETGDFALVGMPTAGGWEFQERNELAPKISELVKVLTGDMDAKFVTLPIDLP